MFKLCSITFHANHANQMESPTDITLLSFASPTQKRRLRLLMHLFKPCTDPGEAWPPQHIIRFVSPNSTKLCSINGKYASHKYRIICNEQEHKTLTLHKIGSRLQSPHNLSSLGAVHTAVLGFPHIGHTVLICETFICKYT